MTEPTNRRRYEVQRHRSRKGGIVATISRSKTNRWRP